MCPQFAPVCPPQLLRALRSYGNSVPGKYHLLLAHDVASRRADYWELVPDGSIVIMDNSVIELGHPVSTDIMKTALSIVPSRFIVLPDKVKDIEATLKLSSQGSQDYMSVMQPHQKFMAVPQGKDMEELKACARALVRLPRVGAWGVGRFVADMLGTRTEFVKWLWEDPDSRLEQSQYGPFIHLLGFSSNLRDDLETAKLPGVIGIDSAVPLRMGQQGKVLSTGQVDPGPRGDWWTTETGVVNPCTIANLSLIRGWLNDKDQVWVRPHSTLEGADSQRRSSSSTQVDQRIKLPGFHGGVQLISEQPLEEGATDAPRDQDVY